MSLREVIKLPNPLLRKKAHKLTDFGKTTQVLIDDMVHTMREEPGVGLAAPQVNVSLRLIVVEYAVDDSVENPQLKLFVVANPQIVHRSSEMVKGIEGCLSVPNIFGEVERVDQVVVEGLNRHGKKQKIAAAGWLARIFQHEIDHLDGILFVDRAEKLFRPDEVEDGSAV